MALEDSIYPIIESGRLFNEDDLVNNNTNQMIPKCFFIEADIFIPQDL